MGVFNATQGQVLAQPVSNYYKGEAIRGQLAAGKQDSELRGLQIDSAKRDAKNAAEDRKRQKAAEDQLTERNDQIIAKAEADGQWTELERGAQITGPLYEQFRIDGDVEKFNQGFKAIQSQFDSEKMNALDENNDGVISAQEIGQGGSLYDAFRKAESAKMAALNPKDFTPASWANFESTGRQDRSQLRAIEKGPLVSISNSGETAATKAYGASVGGSAGERDDKAQATYAADADLSRLELALSRGARTGFGEDLILDIRGALDTLGMAQLPEGATETEVARSIGNILALKMRNPDSGLGLTGNTSNKDLTFLKASVAGIGRSEGGNMLLIKMAKKLNQFTRDIATEQSRIIANGGGVVPMSLNAQLMGYANDYDMFTDTERKQMESALSDSKVTDGTGAIGDASDDQVLRDAGLIN